MPKCLESALDGTVLAGAAVEGEKENRFARHVVLESDADIRPARARGRREIALERPLELEQIVSLHIVHRSVLRPKPETGFLEMRGYVLRRSDGDTTLASVSSKKNDDRGHPLRAPEMRAWTLFAQGGELFHELFLSLLELFRHDDHELREQIAVTTSLELWHAFAFEPHAPAWL